MNLEYNTQRPQLKINDYGRNVYKLIEFAKTLQNREQRNKTVAAIVEVMAQVSGESSKSDEQKRKFWVHLMILSNWELDVDLPYDISREESVEFTPKKLHYGQAEMKYRHYGSVMEKAIERAAEYPEGEERDEIVGQIAHAMKRDYLMFNRDTVEDDVIGKQLQDLSSGVLQLRDDFQFKSASEYLAGMEDATRITPKKKKKKK